MTRWLYGIVRLHCKMCIRFVILCGNKYSLTPITTRSTSDANGAVVSIQLLILRSERKQQKFVIACLHSVTHFQLQLAIMDGNISRYILQSFLYSTLLMPGKINVETYDYSLRVIVIKPQTCPSPTWLGITMSEITFAKISLISFNTWHDNLTCSTYNWCKLM